MADNSDKKKKESSNVVIPGRKTTDWLKILAKDSFTERKYADASNAFRTQLVNEATSFAKKIRDTMPTSAVQITLKAVELTACAVYPKDVGFAISARIADAMEKYKKSKAEDQEKDEEAKRVLFDKRCDLKSVSDCFNILKNTTSGAVRVVDQKGEVHKKTFTLSKGAHIGFAAVINVLASIFAEEVLVKFEARYPKKKADEKHTISMVEVRDAAEVLRDCHVFWAMPDVFDSGSHKRKRVIQKKEKPAENEAKVQKVNA